MKKAAILTGSLLSAALITGALRAQDTKARTDLVASSTTRVNPAASASAGGAFAPASSKIAARAVKDLRSRFTNVTDEQWSYSRTGSWVYFTSGGFRTRSYYDARGHWQASIKYCGQAQLPHFIRDIVRRTYYDLAITGVVVVDVPDHTAYVVDLEDATTLKIIRVNDEGEMDLMHDYIKSN